MNCGDPVIDGLLAGEASVQALTSGASGVPVGYLQELLRGHGYALLGDPRGTAYGVYGTQTCHAVSDYRARHGLPAGEHADSALIGDIVRRPAPNAVIGPAYVPLVLNVPFTPILRFIWLTAIYETNGAFATLNLNTDQCGVSFGILQWSQKPGQLHAILEACMTSEPAEWNTIMGGNGILDHTAKPNGGVDGNGVSIDAAFELTKDPWKSRLEALGASQVMQRVQIDVASNAYSQRLVGMREFATEIASERGFGFLLDLGNQFGWGRVESQYQIAAQPGVAESGILQHLEDYFTSIAKPQFRPQVRARREFFRTTALLSDQPLPR